MAGATHGARYQRTCVRFAGVHACGPFSCGRNCASFSSASHCVAEGMLQQTVLLQPLGSRKHCPGQDGG